MLTNPGPRHLGASIGLEIAVFLTSAVTFLATCSVGALIGTLVCASGAYINEHYTATPTWPRGMCHLQPCDFPLEHVLMLLKK